MELLQETEFWESTAGKIPKGWQALELKEGGKLTDGDWILKEDYTNKGVRLLQVGDIGVGKFTNKSNRFISEERAKKLNVAFVNPNGDVLISKNA